jgi:hypothetical protein
MLLEIQSVLAANRDGTVIASSIAPEQQSGGLNRNATS